MGEAAPAAEMARTMLSATTEVLRLISEHPGELRTVLQGILAQARRLCDADQGHVILMRDDETVTIAADDYPTGSFTGRVVPAGKIFHGIDQPVHVRRRIELVHAR